MVRHEAGRSTGATRGRPSPPHQRRRQDRVHDQAEIGLRGSELEDVAQVEQGVSLLAQHLLRRRRDERRTRARHSHEGSPVVV